MVSELGISHTFRHDTGVYICQAGNSFGQVRIFFHLDKKKREKKNYNNHHHNGKYLERLE